MAVNREPEYCSHCGSRLKERYRRVKGFVGDTFLGYQQCKCWKEKPIPPTTQDGDEKEIMMQSFDKVRQIFERRSWIMEGRGSYRYDDDRYKEEVRYLYDEFEAIRKDTWGNIKSKSFEYRQKVIKEFLSSQPKEVKGGVWVKAENKPKKLLQSYYCIVYSEHFKIEFRRMVLITLDGSWQTDDKVLYYLDESQSPIPVPAGQSFIVFENDKVNSILSAALRVLDNEQLIALRDSLIDRTPVPADSGWISDYLKKRIEQLKTIDGEFCKDRWDMKKSTNERSLARDMSNETTARRHELEDLLKALPPGQSPVQK